MTAPAATYKDILAEAERLHDAGSLDKTRFRELEAALKNATAEMPNYQQGDLLEALYVMADPSWIE